MLNKTTALALLLLFAFSCQYSETRAVTVPLQDVAVEATQDQGDKQGMDPKKLMEEVMRLGTPGEAHKNLAGLIGDWNLIIKMRMGPDQPWTESKGTATYKSILGGRYIVETMKSDFMGMPFEGMQILGYNNFSKKYTAIWMDSMNTWPMTSNGTVSDDGKTITLKGIIVDNITPKGRAWRSVCTNETEDKSQIEMYDTIAGKDVKVMSITCTRKNVEGAATRKSK